MVNRENILKVADAIENHSIKWLGFNMASWFDADARHPWSPKDNTNHNCGTVACIGGWAGVLAMGKKTEKSAAKALANLNETRIHEFLGLETEVARSLFLPSHKVVGKWSDITPAQAVRVLRHLAETGKVNWRKAGKGASSPSSDRGQP